MMRSLSPAPHGRRGFLSAVAVMCLLLCQTAMAVDKSDQQSPTHKYTLDNGLKILVKQDKRAPVAVVQVWYRVGTSYEHEGITGLSHALEHMLFKGTKTRKSGEFEKLVSAIGARNNAFTSKDYTAYYEVLASDKVEEVIEIEADRMRNVVFVEEEFEKEIEVVKEERRWRTDDKPSSLLREQFNATAFLNNPYRSPVIGWMVDLNEMTMADAEDWYKKWYTPNNATLVVVGDVDPENIHAWAKKYFGAYKSNPLPVVKARTEVEQQGIRSTILKRPAKLGSLWMGYKAPAMISAKQGKVSEWEPYALEVLANILSGGDSARFAKNIVREKELAASVGAWYSGYGRMDNMLMVYGTPATGVTMAKLKSAVFEEIGLLKTTLVSEKELKRVKAQVIASEVYQRDSIEHIATVLGSLDAVGLGHEYMDQYLPGILMVTPEQIQAVARKYLNADRLTIGELIPLPLEGADNNKKNKQETK